MSDIHCDKHGDYIIPRGTLALITVVMLLIGAIATVTITGSTITSDIKYLRQKQDSDHDRITQIEDKITTCEIHVVSTNVRLGQITTDLGEIKTDVKEMLRK
jgi:hypothetical protein